MSHLHNHACLIHADMLASPDDGQCPSASKRRPVPFVAGNRITCTNAYVRNRKNSLAVIQLNMRKGRENNARLPFAYNEARKCSPLLSVRQKNAELSFARKGGISWGKNIEMTVPAV